MAVPQLSLSAKTRAEVRSLQRIVEELASLEYAAFASIHLLALRVCQAARERDQDARFDALAKGGVR
jgi:hypothetical protein